MGARRVGNIAATTRRGGFRRRERGTVITDFRYWIDAEKRRVAETEAVAVYVARAVAPGAIHAGREGS